MAETASHYLGGVRMDILEYTNKWERFANIARTSYRRAYQSQAAILTKVKQTIDARKKRDIEIMTFTLSLLTLGVAGTLTNRFVKKLTDGAKSAGNVGELAAKIASDSLILDWTGDTMKALSKRAAEKLAHDPLLDKLNLKNPAPNGDAFSPAGMNPEEYGDRLSAGILLRSEILSDFARAFYDAFAESLPVENARAAKQALRQSRFFTDVPTGISEEALTRSAKQALWIGWAKARDLPYWEKANHEFNPEVWELTPIRDELVALGAPAGPITRINKMAGLYTPGRRQPPYSIDMVGLIRWARSPQAGQLLFGGLAGNAGGIAAARQRLQSMLPV
ncbi:MAG: hypothetical protein KJZ84_19850 [Bryobacteraceae bacterium]|nr:hypothetical protein [Bryobacteraceae bacterium]